MPEEKLCSIEARVEDCLTNERAEEGKWPVYLFESGLFSMERPEVAERIRERVLNLLSAELGNGASFNIKEQRLTPEGNPSMLQTSKTQARLLNLRGILNATSASLIKRGMLPRTIIRKGEELRSVELKSGN